MNFFTSPNEPKLYAFEYVLKSLLNWNYEETRSEDNDLSTLKAIKLLFFVTAVNSGEQSENILLNEIFSDFVAMPYGHVESVIYEEIRNRKGVLNFYLIDNIKTVTIPGKNPNNLKDHVTIRIRTEIDRAVSQLRIINSELILLSAFDLVDLSHSWYSWKKIFSHAKSENVGSKTIPKSVIIREDKNFSLSLF